MKKLLPVFFITFGFSLSNAQIISTVAGTGVAGYSGDGGQATLAQLNTTNGITTDASGNLYIADAVNNYIRKVSTSGVITTIAGSTGYAYNGDGIPATTANLYTPGGVAVDAAGNLYICDSYNSRVRKVNTSGIISTIAGN